MKGKIWGAVALAVMMVLPAGAITRKDLASYASSLKGLKKAELKTAIYKLCQPTKVLSYGSGSGATWSGFVKTDRIGSTLECRNRYSTDRYYFSSSSQTSAISGMNIEHSFPKSWWGGSTNNAYKDLYNLYPSASDANSSKSNYPMGKVTNASILDDYEKVGTGDAGGTTIRLCEPADEWKGDFCRSYFYMATIYQNLTWSGEGSSTSGGGLQSLENDTWPTLREWAYTLYLEWTRNDSVNSIEVDRNNAVYAIQGNRNLYIDFPNLAEYVWGDSTDVAFNPNYAITSAEDETRAIYSGEGGGGGEESEDTTSTDPVDPDPDEPVVVNTSKYYFRLVNQITSGKQYLMAAPVTGQDSVQVAKPIETTSSKTYGYPYGDEMAVKDGIIGTDELTDAMVITAVSGGYTLNLGGVYLYQTDYNSFSVTDDASTSGALWSIEFDDDCVATITNEKAQRFIQYNTKYSSYGSYLETQSTGILPKLYELCPTGDVNLDGKVDVDDVAALVAIILGEWDTSKPHGDTNINGDDTEADEDDVEALVNIVVELV